MLVPSSWACYDSIGSRCYGRTGCLTRSLNVCFRWRTPKTMRKTSCKEKSRSGSPVEGLGRSTRGASARPSRTTWMPAVTSRWVWSPSAWRCAVGFPCAEESWWGEMRWFAFVVFVNAFLLLGNSWVLWIWALQVVAEDSGSSLKRVCLLYGSSVERCK